MTTMFVEEYLPGKLLTIRFKINNLLTYRQAVVVMNCDNPHMNEDMLLDPGLVMIFAHGIE